MRQELQVQTEPEIPSEVGMQPGALIPVPQLPVESQGEEFSEEAHGHTAFPDVPAANGHTLNMCNHSYIVAHVFYTTTHSIGNRRSNTLFAKINK